MFFRKHVRGRLLIFQIHAPHSGVSGYYVNEIVKALEGSFDQVAFVNAYYGFDADNRFKKVFFRFSEKMPSNHWAKRLGRFRRGIKFLEMAWGYAVVLLQAFLYRPRIINFSLLDSMPLTQVFIRLLHCLPFKKIIVVTVHDVVPYKTKFLGFTFSVDAQQRLRRRIFKDADYLIVHDQSTVPDLCKLGVSHNKIRYHAHPVITDLDGAVDGEHGELRDFLLTLRKSGKRLFVYVGHIRFEKGVDTLIEAWSKFCKINSHHLIIAGAPIAGLELRTDLLNPDLVQSVTLRLRMQSDGEMLTLIDCADFIVLPYKALTNSGVLHLLASRGAIPIVSNLEAFRDSQLTFEDLTFEAGNADSLSRCLNYASQFSETKIGDYHSRVLSMVSSKEANFRRSIIECYAGIAANRFNMNLPK